MQICILPLHQMNVCKYLHVSLRASINIHAQLSLPARTVHVTRDNKHVNPPDLLRQQEGLGVDPKRSRIPSLESLQRGTCSGMNAHDVLIERDAIMSCIKFLHKNRVIVAISLYHGGVSMREMNLHIMTKHDIRAYIHACRLAKRAHLSDMHSLKCAHTHGRIT